MGKTVTISVSTKNVKETVDLEGIGISEDMNDKAIKKAVELITIGFRSKR